MSPVRAVPLRQSKQPCHPEAAESLAKRAAPNEGSLYFVDGGIRTGCPISRVLCEKWDGVRQKRRVGAFGGGRETQHPTLFTAWLFETAKSAWIRASPRMPG